MNNNIGIAFTTADCQFPPPFDYNFTLTFTLTEHSVPEKQRYSLLESGIFFLQLRVLITQSLKTLFEDNNHHKQTDEYFIKSDAFCRL